MLLQRGGTFLKIPKIFQKYPIKFPNIFWKKVSEIVFMQP